MSKLWGEERRELRSQVAAELGLDYHALDIKGPGRPVKRNQVEWPFSDEFIDRLMLRKYPNQARNKNQRRKADELFYIIYLYHRYGISASHIAEIEDMTLKQVERRIEEATKVANKMIKENVFCEIEQPDRITARTKPGVVLVSNFKIAVDEVKYLRWLAVGPSDPKIRAQAMQALLELEQKEKELREIAAHDRPLLAA